MAGIGDILSGKSAQIADIFMYSVFGQVVSALMAPYFAAIQQDQFGAHPDLVLTPGELAQMVLRGWMAEGDAAPEAAKSGLDADRFGKLWRSLGLPIAPQQAAEALRRGFIPEDSGAPGVPGFLQAIQEGDLANWWAPVVKQLATLLPSPVDAISSDVRGELDKATAEDYYKRFGGDPAYYDMLYNLAGTPISAGEAGQLANRGLIPWTGSGPDAVTFEQAVRESHTKDKWIQSLAQLAVYVPPPRTIVTLIGEGAITAAQAQTYFEQNGMTPDLAAIYTQGATNTKVAKHKDLAEATVLSLYSDQLINSATATDMLSQLGYDANESGFILAVQDTKREETQLNAVVSRLRTLYIARKIDDTTTINALNSLGIASQQVDNLMQLWKLEFAANVQIPTKAEILDAFHYTIIDQPTAQSYLEHLGFSPQDAWFVLSVKEHVALPNKPGA